jgi:hypothetical protein
MKFWWKIVSKSAQNRYSIELFLGIERERAKARGGRRRSDASRLIPLVLDPFGVGMAESPFGVDVAERPPLVADRPVGGRAA